MEGTPSYLHYTEVLNIFQQIEGVQRVHNLRIWALSINKIALSVHLAIGKYHNNNNNNNNNIYNNNHHYHYLLKLLHTHTA